MRTLSTLTLVIAGSTAAMAQGYEATLITPPASMTTVAMPATVVTTDFYGQQQSVECTVQAGNADGHVYMQGLCPDYPEAWLMGTASKDKSSITFTQGQYIGQDFYFDLYVSGYRGDVARRCDLILQRNAATGQMHTDENTSYCAYYYDTATTSGNRYLPFSRYVSVILTPQAPWEPADPQDRPIDPDEPHEPVAVPEDVVLQPYTLTATNIRTGSITHPARLGFSGDVAYLTDFCNVAIQTKTAVRGYRIANDLVFPKEQFIVRYQGTYDMYLYGATYYMGDTDVFLDDLRFTYDPLTDTYTGQNGILISTGKFSESGDFSEYIYNVILSGTSNGIGTAAPAGSTRAPAAYSPDGRRLGSPRGLYFQGGRKRLAAPARQ